MESDYLFWVVYKMGENKRKRDRRTYVKINKQNRSGELKPQAAKSMNNQFEKAVLSKPLASHEIKYALANSELYEGS